MISFETHPERYSHWKLSFDGALATLALDVAEDKPLVPGYKLKLNSYDLGVDIELHDALNRIRFEHPEAKAVVITSGKSRIFCSGANIYMLGTSSHAWKVNFCKFTNETRNGIEDSSAHSGLKFLAALNGATAGGGYELALACDEIAMIDDRSSTVSLPEVPLLGVLPGTGGLTRLVDKRKVRRDLADVFCTTAEGVRAERAREWKLVDHVFKPQQFADLVKHRALELARQSDRPGGAGVALTPLGESKLVEVKLDPAARTAEITVKGPERAALERNADWYPLRLARELDRAILDLRHNQLDIGLWVLKTRGNPEEALKLDALLADRIGPLEDPVLPRGEPAEDASGHRFRAGEAQAGFHPGQRVGAQARALLERDADFVLPVDLIRRRGDQAELSGTPGIQHLVSRNRRHLAAEMRLDAGQAVGHRVSAEVERRQRNSRPAFRVEHVAAVGGERDLQKRAGEAGARLDQREHRARRDVEAGQGAPQVADHLADKPVVLVLFKQSIKFENLLGVAFGFQSPQT